jgi:hypothetical protein
MEEVNKKFQDSWPIFELSTTLFCQRDFFVYLIEFKRI